MTDKTTQRYIFPSEVASKTYKKGYEDGLNRGKDELAEALDKIRAEILALNDDYCSTQEVLNIIDKHIGGGK